jgi:RND family efflux transporter MFP subunit
MGHNATHQMNDYEPASEHKSGVWRKLAPILVLLLFAGLALWGIESRREVRASLSSTARSSSKVPVAVVHAKPSDTADDLVLPGNIQAYLETPIYARTNGYLKKWYVDIGGRVRQGQLLADIDTPEVDQELDQAEAAELQAKANLDLAKITADRWVNLLKSDGVSQQEVDQNVSAYKARQADMAAAQANTKRLKYLQSFKEVVAPFSGIITARNVDVGALISNGNTQQLFRIAQTNVLRIYINVPQSYSRSVTAGLGTELQIPEFPHRMFPGKVARTAGAIDPTSRTLLTEVQVPNPTGELLPGAYATVHFHLKLVEPPLTIPPNTLLFRSQGTQVATVTGQNTVHLKSIVIGRDLGTSMEVLDGIGAGDNIILNPPDSIGEGDAVEVTQAPSPGQSAPAASAAPQPHRDSGKNSK